MRHAITLALLLSGVALAQEMELQVELINRVGTDTSRKGDLVTARIVSPAGFQSSTVEGKITESISGERNRGQSALEIDFDMLRHGGTVTPINSRITSVMNARGQANVDSQGRVIARGQQQRPSSGTGGLGRTLGGLAGGRGARIGDAVDRSATAVARMSVDAPNLVFDAGSKFILRASARSGPSLASLAAAPAAAAPPPAASSPAPASTPTPTAPAAVAAPAAAAGAGQPNLVAVKAEFIPGDKAFFYDDFTDMTGEDAPPHWKVRGGTGELRKAEDIRQLTMTARQVVLTPNLTGFPKNFTMESVMKYAGHGVGVVWRFRKANTPVEAMWMRLEANYKNLIIQYRVGPESIISQQIPMDWNQPIRQALWLQNGRLRLYINGERIFDANQINVTDLVSADATVTTSQTPGQPERLVGFQMVRFAESVPDYSQVLTTSGRYIVRGIFFDTDSDRIKPESAAAIRQIAKTLEANPALKLLIEGHTDSTGDAAHNLDLSRRRAEAVKAVLVGQFQVDAGRLSAAGLGSTKPVESNDTPQGKAQNRRVELVKL